MQKVGFQGKKWDQSPFSDVVRKKDNFNTDMIFLELHGHVILDCSNLVA